MIAKRVHIMLFCEYKNNPEESKIVLWKTCMVEVAMDSAKGHMECRMSRFARDAWRMKRHTKWHFDVQYVARHYDTTHDNEIRHLNSLCYVAVYDRTIMQHFSCQSESHFLAFIGRLAWKCQTAETASFQAALIYSVICSHPMQFFRIYISVPPFKLK